MIMAQAWGPTTGQATATGGLNPTFKEVGGLQGRHQQQQSSPGCCAVLPAWRLNVNLCLRGGLLQWKFTATPAKGGPAVTLASPIPEVRFYGLTPNTFCEPVAAGRQGCLLAFRAAAAVAVAPPASWLPASWLPADPSGCPALVQTPSAWWACCQTGTSCRASLL